MIGEKRCGEAPVNETPEKGIFSQRCSRGEKEVRLLP